MYSNILKAFLVILVAVLFGIGGAKLALAGEYKVEQRSVNMDCYSRADTVKQLAELGASVIDYERYLSTPNNGKAIMFSFVNKRGQGFVFLQSVQKQDEFCFLGGFKQETL